jgi:hypothetical protein
MLPRAARIVPVAVLATIALLCAGGAVAQATVENDGYL